MNQHMAIDDCWNRIGVWAPSEKRNCEQLIRHGHCRNCSVYKDAGRQLLQRPAELLDPGLIPDPVVHEKSDVTYVCFRVGVEWFSLNTDVVITTVNPMPVRKIPHVASAAIEGICYSNGDSLLVINLAALFPGLSTQEDQDDGKKSFQRFLLINSPLGPLALRVSEVWGTHRCSLSDFKQLSVTDTEKDASLVRYRLPWEGGEISDIEIKVLYQMLQQQL